MSFSMRSCLHILLRCKCKTDRISIAVPLSPRGSASILPYRERDEHDKDANAPGQRQQNGRGVGMVEEQSARRVDDLRNRLMLCEGAQPGGHALCRHERATGEGQRKEPDEACGLRRLYTVHCHAYGC